MTHSASDTKNAAAVMFHTRISGWITAPATNVALGKRSSRNRPDTGSLAANVINPGTPWSNVGTVPGVIPTGKGSLDGTLTVTFPSWHCTGGT
jgi:hypothetical protein